MAHKDFISCDWCGVSTEFPVPRKLPEGWRYAENFESGRTEEICSDCAPLYQKGVEAFKAAVTKAREERAQKLGELDDAPEERARSLTDVAE